jgi:hypothetical protein
VPSSFPRPRPCSSFPQTIHPAADHLHTPSKLFHRYDSVAAELDLLTRDLDRVTADLASFELRDTKHREDLKGLRARKDKARERLAKEKTKIEVRVRVEGAEGRADMQPPFDVPGLGAAKGRSQPRPHIMKHSNTHPLCFYTHIFIMYDTTGDRVQCLRVGGRGPRAGAARRGAARGARGGRGQAGGHDRGRRRGGERGL